MAAGFGHREADKLIDTIESEGLDVYALDVHASAIARACSPLLEGVSGIAAVLDLRWDHVNLVLLYQGVVVYERKLAKCRLDTVVDSLVRELKLHRDTTEDLVRRVGLATQCPDVAPETLAAVNHAVGAYCDSLIAEMRIPLSYLTNQYTDASPETLLLAGSGAPIPGLVERLDLVLDFYVRTVRPSDIARCSPEIEETFGSSLTSAAGLGQFSE
jgi:Tfp pilus assembly PilM family ATPase